MTLAASAVTLTVPVTVPDAPLAVIVYCAEAPGQTCLDPLASTFPTRWSIETSAAFVDDQVNVVHSPASTEAGFADNVTVGAGGACVTGGRLLGTTKQR